MIVNGKKISYSSARSANNSYDYEVSTSHAILAARADRERSVMGLRAKKEVFEQEVAELASCERLTSAQQQHMKSLKASFQPLKTVLKSFA